MLELETQDILLLKELQKDARSSISYLSERSHLSKASVQRRIKHFRDVGVIQATTNHLNADLLGQNMTFIVMVEMERERLDQLDEFKKLASNDSNVQQCYYVTGEADFVLICLTSNMADFEALTQRLFFENNNVRRFRTNVVMKKVKVSLDVPLTV